MPNQPKWLRSLLQWLTRILTQQLLLQLIATVPLSFLASKIFEVMRGTVVRLDAVSPIFWLILAILCLVVLALPAFVFPIVYWWKKPSQLRRELDRAYLYLTYAYRPHTVPIEQQEHHLEIPQYAQDAVDIVAPKIPKKFGRLLPFGEINIEDDESIEEWYQAIRYIRPRIK